MHNFRKSRECASGSCAEVADEGPDLVLLRSTNDPDGPTVKLTRQEVGVFAKAWLAGEFGPTGLPDTDPHPAFAAAHKLAPPPATEEESTREVWLRHHAATALAAFAVFHEETRDVSPHLSKGSRPELGYLADLAVTAHHSATLLEHKTYGTAIHLWPITPEAGSLNGENEDKLVDLLDESGINPADIDPRYRAEDFTAPSVLPARGDA